jgi:hypothetical protein
MKIEKGEKDSLSDEHKKEITSYLPQFHGPANKQHT